MCVLAKNLQWHWEAHHLAPMEAHQRDNWYSHKRSETDLKNEDNLKNEDDLKNENDLKYEDDLKNEDNLKN